MNWSRLTPRHSAELARSSRPRARGWWWQSHQRHLTCLHRCVHVAGGCASRRRLTASCRPLSETLGTLLKQVGGRRRSSSGSGSSHARDVERGHGRDGDVPRMQRRLGRCGVPSAASKCANGPLAEKISATALGRVSPARGLGHGPPCMHMHMHSKV